MRLTASRDSDCAFEVAAHDQGAHVIYLGPDGSHIGTSESIPDTAAAMLNARGRGR